MGEVARSLMTDNDHEDDQEAQLSALVDTVNGPTVENEDKLIYLRQYVEENRARN